MKKYMVFLLSAVILLTACENSMSVNEDGGKKERSLKSLKKGAVDGSPYYDVTLKNNSAFSIEKENFLGFSRGQYKSDNGIITIDAKKGTVSINTVTSSIEEFKGKQINAKYEFKVKAAGENLIYLCPVNEREVKVEIDGQIYRGRELPQFALYISLYGFGKRRLEVSPYLEGMSFIKKGTYWK